ncbi:MAG: prolipoprotein diacylglyceryl transferase [Anaerolineales bacterium]|nr:prolipoprotein diacylglyceryl transferase [Anaerolineales bacterium]MCB9128010.1 prolipoprotein diacylglyceryl transferase [Ardenticatenales bacterium]MCB9172026.1 prolipoprotein diacylglyceryl transferase [Ardenticatenales bacterium]
MDPIAFQIGPLAFRWYGLLIVGGALLAAWVAARYAKWRGQNPEYVWDVFVWAMLGGILGARLYHVFSSPAGAGTGPRYYFLEEPWTQLALGSLQIPFPRALAIWEGGLGIFGAIVGGALVVWWYSRRHKLHLPTWLDIGAVGLILGQAIGRWGNFFNQELYGEPTTLPWGITIDVIHRLPQYVDLPVDQKFHPAFLYESLWALGSLLVLLWVSRRFKAWLFPGDIFCLYLILYGIGRFLVEFQRPDAWTIGGLPTAQWIGIGVVVLALFLIWWRHRQPNEVPFIMGRGGPSKSRQQRRHEERLRQKA